MNPTFAVPGLDKGVPLLPPNALFKARLSKKERLPVKVSTVAVTGQPFAKAVQVTTARSAVNWWAIELIVRTVAPVKKGDLLVATFHMRCVQTKDETGEAWLRVFFQNPKTPHNKSVVAQFGASQRWREVTCPFTAAEDSEPGKATFNFTFPIGPQVVQIANLNLVNCRRSRACAAVSAISTISYDGRALDADWRTDAAKRIDQLRKSSLRVVVKDTAGNPLPGAKVVVNMTRHAFPFGCAAACPGSDGRLFYSLKGRRRWFTERDQQEYDYWFKRWFTKAVPAPSLMPDGWTGVWPLHTRQIAIDGVKRYHALGYDVRGHMLVWPGWKWFNIPGIKYAKRNPKRLAKLVIDHVVDEVSTLKPWINEWTLLNEVYNHHDVMDVIGNRAMVDWFKVAQEANPDAILYINDFGILSGYALDTRHQNGYAKTIEYLLDKGAPVHGIGLQGHFGDDPTEPERVYEIIDRFAAYGKEIQITEFDVNTRDLQLQADYTRDFITLCFSHPAVIGFSFWGFWQRDHWRKQAALIDNDWNLKPNGEAYEQLVLHDWWTEEEGVTDETGTFAARGFLGDYHVVVRTGGRSLERHVTLKREGATLEVVIDAEPAHAPKRKARAAK